MRRFFWRWFWQLPSPLTEADIDAGYTYAFAFRQFEISDTRVFDQPQSGRAFFEALIRDHLDLGRPSKVSLIFDRKVISTTPGPFTTKVITDGVDPEISCRYKKSRIKQYFKEHCALRTETVINDTKNFAIGRSLTAANWRKLRCVGENANQRLCDAQAIDAAPAPDAATITLVTRRSVTADNLPASGLPIGDPRVMAVLGVLLHFRHIFAGFRNADLVTLVAAMLDIPYTSRQATYDLRRLRRKGIIERIPRTNRYQVTAFGRRVAVVITKEHARFMAPALPLLDTTLPAEIRACSPLAEAWYHFEQELDRYIEAQLVVAA